MNRTQRRGELHAFVDGIALWSAPFADWDSAAAAFRAGEAAALPDIAVAPRRPAPMGLAANERRRAPDSVLVALQVAEAAVAASGHDARTLASVFCSAHGDLAIVDALCKTLARDPLLLSPTRFHHSVHNAAAGYWAMSAMCQAPSTALAAFEASFALGLFEALVQCTAEHRPVLLVGFDTAAHGALASVNRSRGLLGMALVLAPERAAASSWQLQAELRAGDFGGEETMAAARRPRTPAARALAGNALADALPLAEALALGEAFRWRWPLGTACALQLEARPLPETT